MSCRGFYFARDAVSRRGFACGEEAEPGDGYSHPAVPGMLGDSLVQSPGWLTPRDAILVFNYVASIGGSRGFSGVWDHDKRLLRWGSARKALRPLRSLLLRTSERPQRLSWLQRQRLK